MNAIRTKDEILEEIGTQHRRFDDMWKAYLLELVADIRRYP